MLRIYSYPETNLVNLTWYFLKKLLKMAVDLFYFSEMDQVNFATSLIYYLWWREWHKSFSHPTFIRTK